MIVFAYKFHRHFPFVIAANRDEFYDRPTEAASYWHDAPHILAGRDLKGGGTWLGLTTDGRIAALTNHRNPSLLKRDAPSRGLLVSEYLRGDSDAKEYLEHLRLNSGRYNGFNLIAGDLSALYYYSNISGELTPIEPGIHALSNHLLDTPWPKVARAKEFLAGLLSSMSYPSAESVLEILDDRVHPPDTQLPDTGVGLEWERMLSPVFITSPFYGTCSSTAILIDTMNRTTFVEKVTAAEMKGTIGKFMFDISSPRNSEAISDV